MLLANRTNNFFDDFFKDPFFHPGFWNNNQMMKADVKEQDGNYVIEMELPGYKKEDLHCDLKDGYLTVSAEHNEEKEEKEKGRYIRRERYTGSVSRSFYVGKDITEEDVSAGFTDGILTLCLPKEKEPVPEEKKLIEIK